MPNKHLYPKVGWHLPDGLVRRLREHTARTGETATDIVTAGVTAELDRREHPQSG